MVKLKRKDIDLDNRSVIVRIPTKNRIERTVFFPRSIMATKRYHAINMTDLLRDYFSYEQEDINAFNMSHPQLKRLIKALKPFAPKKNLTVHTFRHSFARMLAREGIDSRVAQKLLGHKDIQSTMIYYDPDIDIIQELYEKKVK